MKPKPKKGKTRTGRPPVAAEDKRDTLVRVLTTKGEHAELQHAAEVATMSVSTWVRWVALDRARREEADRTKDVDESNAVR